ncbi:hypothetical protein [Dysgonomonas sp. 520]|uniref:hypothetical protein n=1 Tax=Dysgonomonas sp. 520 TaxID=2302931 RepID=UPI0013D53BC8|nr:hypothetical protein [Dysgonomonas sp. 520]NDW10506.1 hypothetical protein [Dysgonomonas sp. 520]
MKNIFRKSKVSFVVAVTSFILFFCINFCRLFISTNQSTDWIIFISNLILIIVGLTTFILYLQITEAEKLKILKEKNRQLLLLEFCGLLNNLDYNNPKNNNYGV